MPRILCARFPHLGLLAAWHRHPELRPEWERDHKLRDDPRVIVLERTNARALTELPFAPQLVVCDVSFISVRRSSGYSSSLS